MEKVFNKTNKVILAIIAILTIIGASSNCFAATKNTKAIEKELEKVKITSITLSSGNIVLREGDSKKLTATVKPKYASNKQLKWTSSNSKVASVSNGVVKAIKEGKAVITATATDGSSKKTSCTITVKAKDVKITSITLSGARRLKIGETLTVGCKVSPSNANNKQLKWTSSNPNVASVSSNGVVKAKKAGTATITAKTQDGSNIQRSVKIEVLDKNNTSKRTTYTNLPNLTQVLINNAAGK